MDAHFELVDRGPVRPAARRATRPPPTSAALRARGSRSSSTQLREEQVVGAVRTRDEALRFARRWAASHS